MPIPSIPYIQYDEKLVGANHPLAYADTINRPIQTLVDYLQSGESDIPVARINIKIQSVDDIALDVVNDDVVWYNPVSHKFERAYDEMTGIIDIDGLAVYTFGIYNLKSINTLVNGTKYYLDSTNPGKLTTDTGKLVGIAYGTNTILNVSLYNQSLESKTNKGVPNGYAPLNSSNLIPNEHLPSYVDDVLEYADLASLPLTGESGKIYIALDTGFMYRWSGSLYINITSGVSSVNGETGIVVLDKTDIGLGNVDNTSDLNKPVSTATINLLNTVNLTRADKFLAAQNVVSMLYNVTTGKLEKVRYNNDTDVNYEVLSYTDGKLSNVAHYVGGILQGNTILSYSAGKLVSAPFVGV